VTISVNSVNRGFHPRARFSLSEFATSTGASPARRGPISTKSSLVYHAKKSNLKSVVTAESFLAAHAAELERWWDQIKDEALQWKRAYEWPRGTNYDAAFKMRSELEQTIKSEIDTKGFLSKAAFDEVLKWGFGHASMCSEREIQDATKCAFEHLRKGRIAQAARESVKLSGVGISRASKVLALSNQQEFGIYDSRSVHGLSDFVGPNGQRIIPIPPGRVIRGDFRKDYCDAFEHYTWILRHLRKLASTSGSLGGEFARVSDLEIALFMRSRRGIKYPNPPKDVPADLSGIAERDEESLFWTLGRGKKAKPFWVTFDDSSVTVWTGERGKTSKTLDWNDIDACVVHFKGRCFPLSNSKTASERAPKGLGEYFFQKFGSSVFASHFAALWVNQGFMEECGKGNKIHLRVLETVT
jgi:hypothetical protein